MRYAETTRKTGETDITVSIDLDGEGKYEINTGIGFFDHVLSAFARHGLFDLKVTCKGDLQVDGHHTVEDTGIVLGQAIASALGDKRGIERCGSCWMPMDEALCFCALDISGRPFLAFDAEFGAPMCGDYATELTEEFFRAVAVASQTTLHLKADGKNSHHIVEGLFKAYARALKAAVAIDPRVKGIPSTKGVLLGVFMQIYPAIDIKNGKAVRLLRGEADAVTDYGDPVSAALDWKKQGATFLHVVDLDGAFEGSGRNLPILREIVRQTDLPVETGGGIRTMKDIEDRLSAGVRRVILGTVALNHPEIVEEACKRFPGQIAVGLDCKNGLVAVKGWVETSTVTAKELALRMKNYGVMDIIYTDISRDGMLVGPNVPATKQLILDTNMNILGSGGVSSLQDLIDLKEAGCAGAIIGKALYSGKVNLSDALKLEE